jgi:hypothetical protein
MDIFKKNRMLPQQTRNASRLIEWQIRCARYRHRNFSILRGKAEVKGRFASCRMEVITVKAYLPAQTVSLKIKAF